MGYAIVGAVCMMVGVVVGRIVGTKKSAGVLKMDYSTGDPFLFLELKIPIEDVLSRSVVQFDVDAQK